MEKKKKIQYKFKYEYVKIVNFYCLIYIKKYKREFRFRIKI